MTFDQRSVICFVCMCASVCVYEAMEGCVASSQSRAFYNKQDTVVCDCDVRFLEHCRGLPFTI